MQNKKAQVSDTMVWLIATIVIVTILGISIFITSTKMVGNKEIPFLQKEIVIEKSMLSYLATKEVSSDVFGNKKEEIIFNQLKENNLNQFNGNLALKIFKEYYSFKEGDMWFGIEEDSKFKKNLFFGGKPRTLNKDTYGAGTIYSVKFQAIKLKENRFLDLFLVNFW